MEMSTRDLDTACIDASTAAIGASGCGFDHGDVEAIETFTFSWTI